MSWLNTAQKKGKRRAKNFTHERAQKRLNETLPVFQNQIENALNVDKVVAIVAKRVRAGRYCTCSKHIAEDSVAALDTSLVDIESDEYTQTPIPDSQPEGKKATMVLDLGSSSLFGESEVERHAPKPLNNKRVEIGDMLREEHEEIKAENPDDVFTFQDAMTSGTGVDCGICYREGRQPAFEFTNFRQSLMTSYDALAIKGYAFDNSTPVNFIQQESDGYVLFEILVPKYFISASYSVRANTDVLPSNNRLYVGTSKTPLKYSDLDQHRGRSIQVSVRDVANFTHAIVMFKLSEDSIQANISQENEMVNYEQEITIGDITVVLPARIGLFRSEDFIIVPERNLVLKVNDVPRKSTADRQVWEWMATTRAVQRSEAAYNIFKSYKLY